LTYGLSSVPLIAEIEHRFCDLNIWHNPWYSWSIIWGWLCFSMDLWL